jgi:hypothetical protein
VKRAAVGLALFALSTGSSCGVDESVPLDECVNGDSECVAENEIRRCLDGHWYSESCVELCEADPRGRHRGCLRLPGPDECACSGPGRCAGESLGICASSYAIYRCTETRVFAETCDDVCAGRPANPLPAGCAYDRAAGEERCFCTSEGAPCSQPVWDQCVDHVAVLRCESGRWKLHPCADECGARPSLGCEPDVDRNAVVCRCG